jgi:LacI family transcriptional regulator
VKTRQRILELAERMGYRRNQLASATRTGQVNTIAVILDLMKYQTITPFNQIMAGIMLESSARRQSVKVFPEDELEDTFRQIVENRINNVIILSVESALREQAAELAEKYSLNLVYAYEHGHRSFPAVNADNIEMTSKMVHYLAEHGHTRIGLLCVPHRYHYIEDRHAGYLRGMKECGLKIDPRWISCSDEIDLAIRRILALPARQRPTALVTLSNSLAARIEAYAIRNGLRFPQDISVFGIGDSDISNILPFPLTTMRESLLETGHLLVRLVMKDTVDIRPDEFNVYQTHAVLTEGESVHSIKNIKIGG